MLPLPQRYRLWAGLTASASDALCRASRPSGNPNAYEEPEPAVTVRASTRPAFPAQSAFHRQVLPRPAFAGAIFWEPATDPAILPSTVRLPTSFRFRESSRPWKLDPPSNSIGSSPIETTGRTPPVDFCNRIKPRARPHERSNPAHRPGGRPPAQLLIADGYAWFQLRTPCSRARAGARPAETPWARGLRKAIRLASAPSTAIAHGGSFAPTHIGSDTSCRKPGTTSAGVAGVVRRAPFGDARTYRACPVVAAFAAPAFEGCFTRLSAKRVTIRAPEVSSIAGPTPCGAGRSLHSMSPSCGLLDLVPFRSPLRTQP
jgi:hypothetical protein